MPSAAVGLLSGGGLPDLERSDHWRGREREERDAIDSDYHALRSIMTIGCRIKSFTEEGGNVKSRCQAKCGAAGAENPGE